MPKGKILIADYYYDNINKEIQTAKDADIELVYSKQCTTEQDVIDAAKDADVIICQRVKITKKVIDSLENCKLIARYAAGVDSIDVKAATEKGIYVSNAADYGIDEVSNQAVALLMSCARKIPKMANVSKQGKRGYQFGVPINRMQGCCLGILGFGKIARLFAKKMQGFGVNILVYDPYVSNEEATNEGVTKAEFDEVVKKSDYISMHLPLTESTRNIINLQAVKNMKKGVIIVNTGRGETLDTSALLYGLKNEIISGAGLDVTQPEPLPADHELLAMDNVIITPHFGFYSEQAIQALQQMVIDDAVRVVLGKTPKNLVNKELLNSKP